MSTRKLAVVLFADIAGYTAMMQRNESLASRLLRRFQDTLQSSIRLHHGKIVNFYGDGALSIFDNSLDALRCAIEIQQNFVNPPEIPVRIGMHSGSVVFEDEMVYGDTVNIASRIESIAVPGSILLSKKIRDDIRNQPGIQVQHLGSFRLKNVDEHTDVYGLVHPELTIPSPHQIRQNLGNTRDINLVKWILGILLILVLTFSVYWGFVRDQNKVIGEVTAKSIAVLEFDYIGEHEDYSYLAAGFHSAIIERLSLIEGLKISPKSSIDYYENQGLPPDEIANRLRVSYYITGVVQKVETLAVARVLLFDVSKDSLCWSTSESFLTDSLLSILDMVSREVTSSMDLHFQREHDKSVKNIDPVAYNLFKKGEYFMGKYTRPDLFIAADLFKQARIMDPQFVAAYVEEAYCYIYLAGYLGGMRRQEALTRAIPVLETAVSIDSSYSETYAAMGAMHWFLEWDHNQTKEVRVKEESLNPDRPIWMLFDIQNGFFERSLFDAERQLTTEPLNPWAHQFKGTSLFFLDRREEAIDVFEQALSLFSYNSDLHWEAGRVFLNSGRVDRAIEVLERGLDLAGGQAPNLLAYLAIGYDLKGYKSKADSILQNLEHRWKNQELSLAFFIAHVYAAREEIDDAINWLNIAYEAHEVEMIWLKTEPQFKPLYDDSRFINLVEKVGFAGSGK